MIGTILALTVILGLISMLVMYWVPIAMEDNEASHMREVIGQFSNMKKTVDDQISSDERNTTRSSPIKLGADGFPMFERETASQLSLKLSDEKFKISFQDSGEDIFENSSGSVELVAFNRFYVRQTLIYENGAVVLHQKKGDIVTSSEPHFLVEKEGNDVIIHTTLISLYHLTDDSITGTHQENVNTRLWYTDTWKYDDITSANRRVNLTIVTDYVDAWEKYYDDTLSYAGLINDVDYSITTTSSTILITIDNVSEITLNHAFVEAYIGKGTL